jgi:hypoxanthine-DNA glycosylase
VDVLKRSFPPVTDARTRLLILGSLPGEESLAQQRYYAHPRNQFWRLIGAVAGLELEALPYEARLEALLGRGIGLWDTVGAARRQGSLDGNIRGIERNALPALVASLPQLRAVGFNGGKSASLGLPQLGGEDGRDGLALVPLPSSSPAYTLPFAAKLAQWRRLEAFLP